MTDRYPAVQVSIIVDPHAESDLRKDMIVTSHPSNPRGDAQRSSDRFDRQQNHPKSAGSQAKPSVVPRTRPSSTTTTSSSAPRRSPEERWSTAVQVDGNDVDNKGKLLWLTGTLS